MSAIKHNLKIPLCILLFLIIFMLITSVSCSERKGTLPEELIFSAGYNTDDEVEQALAKLNSAEESATLLQDAKTVSRVVFLTFDGITDNETTNRLLDLLDKYNVKVSFFLPGIKSAEDPDTASDIAKRGHIIGNYTLTTSKSMEKYTPEELVSNFARTNKLLYDITGFKPDMLMCRSTDYTPDLLKAARASGINFAVNATHYLSYQSLRTQIEAIEFVQGLERGVILSVKVGSTLNETEYVVKSQPDENTDENTTDKEATIAIPYFSSDEDINVVPETATDSDRLITVVDYLLSALEQEEMQILPASEIYNFRDEGYENVLNEIYEGRNEAPEILTNARTTKPFVALAFQSVDSEEKLNKILSALKANNVTASFFVNILEIENIPNMVEKILADGHYVENGGINSNDLTKESKEQILFDIYKCDSIFREQYGVQSKLFMPPFVKIDDKILQVAADFGYTVTAYNKNPLSQGASTKEELEKYFRQRFSRGDIIYCPADKLEDWDIFIKTIAELVRDTGYDLAPVSEIAKDQYPVIELTQIPGWDNAKINNDFDPEYVRPYYGISRINTDDKVIFFTFDDWGSDKTITRLLAVLEKYDAKASFFVRVNGAETNPNLARAIFEEGHDVLNHSYAHRVVTELEIDELQADAVKAHRSLTEILGEAPHMFYRPPTLYYNNAAINALYALGFELVFSFMSTHDYERTAKEVADLVLKDIVPGEIVVMHMSDNACAADALEIALPKLKAKGYKFAKLTDYLSNP